MLYKILICGYGSDSAFYSLNNKAKKFWGKVINSDNDELLTDYLFDNVDESEIDKGAQFLEGADCFSSSSFIEENSSICLESSYVEILGEDGSIINIPFINEDTGDFNLEIEWLPQQARPKGHILHVNNLMKGSFFEGEFESDGFDLSKLELSMEENFVGLSMISSIRYDGGEIYNNGSSERGKGRVYEFV